jgi:hypothetical protein
MIPLRHHAATSMPMRLRPAGAGLARPDALQRRHGHRVPGAHRRDRQRRAVAPAGALSVMGPVKARPYAPLKLSLASSTCGSSGGWRRARCGMPSRDGCGTWPRPTGDLPAAQAHHLCAAGSRACERDGLGPRSLAIAVAAWRGLYAGGAARPAWCRPTRPTACAAQGWPRPLPKALSVDHAVALAEHMPETDDPALAARDHCLVELLYGCGLRVGELVGWTWPQGRRPPPAGWTRPTPARCAGKGGKRRSVPVGRPALVALAAWRVQRAALAMARPRAALFVSRRGTRLSATARCASG